MNSFNPHKKFKYSIFSYFIDDKKLMRHGEKVDKVVYPQPHT